MSCKHGNWPPCDECDADDVLYMRIQNLENECADWTKGYGLLFKQNGQLRDLIELMFSSTMPYDKSGQPTFSDAVVNLWSNLNQVDSAGPSACYDEPQPAPAAHKGQATQTNCPERELIEWTDYWPENARVPRVDPRSKT